MTHVPEDIAIDILLRLPVKPLLRFKCVSKTWYSLISDPCFIKSHLQLSNNHKKFVVNGSSLRGNRTNHAPYFYSVSGESAQIARCQLSLAEETFMEMVFPGLIFCRRCGCDELGCLARLPLSVSDSSDPDQRLQTSSCTSSLELAFA
ncbi:hypothetical protein RCOM_1028290 [Ricinus communis]|uniref:F-box domain-containing protein n=1 Tax=Ricinus communis TaxID=3988 RepID=B9SK74_RICCO|nr:hypothetical protein RCOM_1028290 [Ricinus communis]